jgi:ATP-dependent helicase/nuclease subunit A
MVSALKARGIRVAGADRLVLTEQIGVQDLIALGDFVNLPEDDLALAAVLKSPLFGLDDDDLLQLAAQRKGSLWQELVARASQNPRWQEAEAALQRLRTRALLVPPFEFYAALLEEGGRSRMLARLGAEAADPIDEFLNLALTYDGISAPSLQGFLSWVRVGRQQIKRDMEQGRDEVRVMTVHGAKGLEAPIVFLPDTCSTRSGRGSLLKLADAAGPPAHLPPFLWPVKGTSNLGVIRRAKQAAESADTEERNRLLYVALTRARDRIYVAGFEGKNAPPDDCWYNLIKEGLKGHLQEIEEQDGRIVRRLKGTQSKPHEKTSTTAPMPGVQMPLPEWATQKAPQEPLLAVSLSPSHLVPLEADASAKRFGARLAEPAILPPLALAQDSRFLRGTLTHALLEHLPGMPKERWPAAAKALIASRGAELPAGTRESIAKETLAILNDPQFASLFGPESRAEVAVVAEVERPDGRSPALRLSGKIDRLVEDRRSVLIVDYKTNRPPPHELTGVAEAYLLQLAAYRLAMQRIFPGRSIRAAILWTDGPRIMEIPEKMLEIHQQRLWELQATRLDA